MIVVYLLHVYFCIAKGSKKWHLFHIASGDDKTMYIERPSPYATELILTILFPNNPQLSLEIIIMQNKKEGKKRKTTKIKYRKKISSPDIFFFF